MSVKFICLHVTMLIKVSGLSAACEHTQPTPYICIPPLSSATFSNACFLMFPLKALKESSFFLPELVKLITTYFFFRLADDVQASESDAFSVTRKPRTMIFLISPPPNGKDVLFI